MQGNIFTPLFEAVDIEDGHQAIPHEFDQIFARHGFERIAGVNIIGHHPVDFREIAFPHTPDRVDKSRDLTLASIGAGP